MSRKDSLGKDRSIHKPIIYFREFCKLQRKPLSNLLANYVKPRIISHIPHFAFIF
jgi:hypothetical protein